MMFWLPRRARLKAEADEREKLRRLDEAEQDLCKLKDRASQAMQTLDERRDRNHWREAIEQLIQGGV